MAELRRLVLDPPMSQRITIGSLPDNVLLDIFDFYQVEGCPYDWETLVHISQRWRYLVFESPIRLDLQLFCTDTTPVRKLLHVWPASLPIAIWFSRNRRDSSWSAAYIGGPDDGVVNIVAALERRDRIRQIYIKTKAGYLSEEILTAMQMQGPFPALRNLFLDLLGEMSTLPDTFMNGSVPCLQDLHLWGISFPSLPRLLLSTTDLTSLNLFYVPLSGYISPVTMATSLSALPKLKTLYIDIESPTSPPERSNRPVPPPTRFVLPALKEFQFRGTAEYLNVLVARIEAPLLVYFSPTFESFNQPDIPQIIRFFGHLNWAKLTGLVLKFNPPHDSFIQCRSWKVTGKWLDWQLSSVAHICSQILRHEMDSTLWSQLLHSFDSVHSLEIPPQQFLIDPIIEAALLGLTEESGTEVFPSLDSLSIVGKLSDEAVQQRIQSFVAAHQHSSRSVIISRREVD